MAHQMSLAYSAWPVTALLVIFGLTYAITYCQSLLAIYRTKDGKSPPLVPYWLPFLGNTLEFARDPGAFMMKTFNSFGNVPVTISLVGGQNIHFISNADYIASMLSLKTARTLTMKNSVILAMGTVFGAPPNTMRIWKSDDSGIGTRPLAGSNVKPQNRIFMNSHKSSLKYLSGANLRDLSKRFMASFRSQLRLHPELGKLPSGSSVEIPDFYSFLQHEMFRAVVSILCGPHIFRLNPSLVEDFWEFDSVSPKLFQGLPYWMAPREYAARDKMLANIKRWHSFARERRIPSNEGLDETQYPEEERLYGSNWMRHRNLDNFKVEGTNADACAADDLGLFFAANGNAIPAAFWLMYFILRTPSLPERVRTEITKHRDVDGIYDLTELTSNPLLSSIYAETLRLRNASLVTRTPIEESFELGPWRIYQGQLIGMLNWVACRNEQLWSTGPPGIHYSLDEFYPERFLIDPQKPGTGALKQPQLAGKNQLNVPNGIDDQKVRFSLDGLGGGWIPYGGGSTICPGRHFAKMEVLGCMATLFGDYDMELLERIEVKPNMDFMMLGMLPPKDRLAIKMTRR